VSVFMFWALALLSPDMRSGLWRWFNRATVEAIVASLASAFIIAVTVEVSVVIFFVVILAVIAVLIGTGRAPGQGSGFPPTLYVLSVLTVAILSTGRMWLPSEMVTLV